MKVKLSRGRKDTDEIYEIGWVPRGTLESVCSNSDAIVMLSGNRISKNRNEKANVTKHNCSPPAEMPIYDDFEVRPTYNF